MTVIINVDLCLQIYDAEINAGALRDRGLLEAAVAAPFASFGDQEAFPTLMEKAARLAFGIAEAQAFHDGNKRLAWLVTVVFLNLNGVELRVDQSEAAYTIRALGSRGGTRREDENAASLTLAEFTQWLARCAGISASSA